MKALVLDRFGGPGEFRLAELPRPEPGSGQVLVKVAYAGVNPADWKDREGHTAAFFDISFPHIIGFDAAGTVADTGPGVSEFSVGDRVFTASDHGQGAPGSYAEYLLVSKERLAKVPDGIDLQSAAAVPIAALTAWQALHAADKGALESGQSVLIHGASGGVGGFAVQMARLAGARVATTCSAANLDYVSGLGSELALDYRKDDITGALAEWAPSGLDLVIDAVGGDTLQDPLALLKPGGRLVSIATLVADGDVAADMAAAANLGCQKILAIMDDSRAGEELSRIITHVEVGEIRLPPVQCFEMTDVAAAHELIQAGHVRGKLVLRIGGE
jgi:NADPH2:quinone reductase